MSRSVGAYTLSRIGKTEPEIGRLCAVSKVSAHNWCTGKKKPGPDSRKMLFTIFAIPLESWDEPHGKRVAKPVATGGEKPATPTGPELPELTETDEPTEPAERSHEGGAQGMARELETFARSMLSGLTAKNPDGTDVSTPLERARVGASIATTLEKLGKMTGEHDLGRKLMKLPFMRRVATEIAGALKPYPDAWRAVAEALDALERESLAQ